MTKILVIEDEPDIAEVISLFGKGLGYEVESELDGLEGFLHIKRSHPDLIILDLMMPKKNGFDLLRKMRQNAAMKKIPLIVLSARGPNSAGLAKAMGADVYLAKPFRLKELFEKAASLLPINKEALF